MRGPGSQTTKNTVCEPFTRLRRCWRRYSVKEDMKEKGDGADGTLRCERGKKMSEYDASERFRTIIRQKTALFYDENSVLNSQCLGGHNRAGFGRLAVKSFPALLIIALGKVRRLHKRPSQVFVPAFLIVIALLFTVAEPLGINGPAITGKIPRAFQPPFTTAPFRRFPSSLSCPKCVPRPAASGAVYNKAVPGRWPAPSARSWQCSGPVDPCAPFAVWR